MGATRTRMRTAAELHAEDRFVETGTPGQRIHLRGKRAAVRGNGTPREVMLFVHGATYPGSSAFDAQLPGGSWLDFAARRGCDAYAIDIRGYGQSWRPAPMDSPARQGRPIVRTAEAVEDLSAAVDYLLDRTGAQQVNLVGWSWGTAICGGYTARHNDKVRSLVLFAPLWIMRDPIGAPLARSLLFPPAWLFPMISDSAVLVGAYRSVTADYTWKRWVRGLSPSVAEQICPRAGFDAWWQEMVMLDPVGAASQPPVVRAPNGVLADLLQVWTAGKSTWNPAEIRVPTLAVVGEWDIDTPVSMAQELFRGLTQSPGKRLEILSRGTHSMSLELNRFDLYERVQAFVETAFEPELAAAGARR